MSTYCRVGSKPYDGPRGLSNMAKAKPVGSHPCRHKADVCFSFLCEMCNLPWWFCYLFAFLSSLQRGETKGMCTYFGFVVHLCWTTTIMLIMDTKHMVCGSPNIKTKWMHSVRSLCTHDKSNNTACHDGDNDWRLQH